MRGMGRKGLLSPSGKLGQREGHSNTVPIYRANREKSEGLIVESQEKTKKKERKQTRGHGTRRKEEGRRRSGEKGRASWRRRQGEGESEQRKAEKKRKEKRGSCERGGDNRKEISTNNCEQVACGDVRAEDKLREK